MSLSNVQHRQQINESKLNNFQFCLTSDIYVHILWCVVTGCVLLVHSWLILLIANASVKVRIILLCSKEEIYMQVLLLNHEKIKQKQMLI